MSVVKGMVRFGEVTYRIVKVSYGSYEAIRISDEVCLGTFQTTPRLIVQSTAADESVMRSVATMAMRQATTSWLRMQAVTPAAISAAPLASRR